MTINGLNAAATTNFLKHYTFSTASFLLRAARPSLATLEMDVFPPSLQGWATAGRGACPVSGPAIVTLSALEMLVHTTNLRLSFHNHGEGPSKGLVESD